LSRVIAVAGKGGTGKTTTSALLIRYLNNCGKTPILAVDADPDSNLPEALGMAGDKTLSTVGGTRQEFFDTKGDVPAGMPKEAYLELKLSQALVESKSIDLLVMGRPEGSGCYCYINNVLRKHLDLLGNNYPYVIIDNEAGLEHLSRRTEQNIDTMIIVSDYSHNGLRAATRVKDLAEEMKLDIKSFNLIINNTPPTVSPQFQKEIEDTAITLLGFIPHSEEVPIFDIENKPVTDLPDTSPVVSAFNTIAEKLF
jgi:CO dehydrogenase maturation factor